MFNVTPGIPVAPGVARAVPPRPVMSGIPGITGSPNLPQLAQPMGKPPGGFERKIGGPTGAPTAIPDPPQIGAPIPMAPGGVAGAGYKPPSYATPTNFSLYGR